jgi:MinD-like ATPase involved in chromosome partitioning or flagellar assembly
LLNQMAELNVITAINDPEFEAMVAGTLFSHGWSVIFRALDVGSLQNFLAATTESKPLLIFSSDLLDLDSQALVTLSPFLDRAIGFLAHHQSEARDGYLARPRDEIELLAMIRSPHRAPMLRSMGTDHIPSRCRVIALTGVNHGEGVTLTALNLAIELTLNGKKVLLIDAHLHMPAIATMMGERHANKDAAKEVSPTLQIFEITRHNATSAVELILDASRSADFIIIDLGRISHSEPSALGRRWESIFTRWVLEVADDLWVFSSPRVVSTRALREFVTALPHMTIRGRVTHLLTHRIPGKKGDEQEEKFLSAVSPTRPHALRIIPFDPRSASAAAHDRSILIESNSRGALRRSLAALALELTQ